MFKIKQAARVKNMPMILVLQNHASMICNCTRLVLTFDKSGFVSAKSKIMQA